MHRYTLQQEEICQQNHHHTETNIIKEIENKIDEKEKLMEKIFDIYDVQMKAKD